VPIVGKAAAGGGYTNVDIEEDGIWVPANLQQIGGIGYIIEGHSMMPALQNGDVAIFKTESSPRTGYTYLFKHEDLGYRCKTIAWKKGLWITESMNPNKDDFPDESTLDWLPALV